MEQVDDLRILAIAKRNGRFNVSLRWRDIPLQKACNAMVRDGLLKKVGRVKREIVYVLPETEWVIKNGYLHLKHCTQSRIIKDSLPREEECTQYSRKENN